MSQLLMFTFAWYGVMTFCWDLLKVAGVQPVTIGRLLKLDFWAAAEDLVVFVLSYFITDALLRRSLMAMEEETGVMARCVKKGKRD